MDKLIGMGVVAAIFVPLERRFGLRPAKILRRGWRTDAVHFFVSHTLSELLTVIPVGLAIAVTNPLVSERAEDFVASWPKALQWAAALLIVEVTGYWAHRAMHRVPLLWRIHAVHHSSEHLDWLAAVRVHPLDQVLGRTLGFAALRLLGFSPLITGGALVVVVLWAIFLHANVRFRLRWLQRVVSTPFFHHWHHAGGADCNFAGLFPFVDRLFGTLRLPQDWPSAYGSTEPVPEGYLAQLKSPLVRASRRASPSDRPSTSPPRER